MWGAMGGSGGGIGQGGTTSKMEGKGGGPVLAGITLLYIALRIVSVGLARPQTLYRSSSASCVGYRRFSCEAVTLTVAVRSTHPSSPHPPSRSTQARCITPLPTPHRHPLCTARPPIPAPALTTSTPRSNTGTSRNASQSDSCVGRRPMLLHFHRPTHKRPTWQRK